MKRALVVSITVFVFMVNLAVADNIRGIDMDFVTIGNAGNAADTQETYYYGSVSCGGVGYNYRIGKYEVTNAQWNAFTAAAGAPTGSDGGYITSAYWTGSQQPTDFVSWYEAAQFCNYLTSGDKSKGAYQFSGNNTNPGSFLGINRDAATAAYGTAYVIPTEDEWYKAAYYKPDGSGYSLYANGTSVAPVKGVDANYDWATGQDPWVWNVGTGTIEQNGTFDMMGNVWEWNETLFSYELYPGETFLGARGGSYSNGYAIVSSLPNSYRPYDESFDLGFRVASVPEPASAVLMLLGAVWMRAKRKR